MPEDAQVKAAMRREENTQAKALKDAEAAIEKASKAVAALEDEAVKALTGETINDFVRTIKLKRAAQYLCKGELRISEILYKSGFNSHSYFTKCFKEEFGMTPTEYQNQ